MVVIAAESIEDAWKRLSVTDADAYWQLKTGRLLLVADYSIDSEEAAWNIDSDTKENGGLANPNKGFPIEPKEFELSTLPVLIQWGSE
jgi:hypothetical protein